MGNGEKAQADIQYQHPEFIYVIDTFEITKFGLLEDNSLFREGDAIIGVLEVEGAEPYTLKSVTLKLGDESFVCPLTKISDTKYTFEIPIVASNSVSLFEIVEYELYWISYGIDDKISTWRWWQSDKPERDSYMPNIVFYLIYKQAEIIDVSTPDQLQNMESGKIYRLTQDLDMTGFDWQPYEFYGVLDGNGYAIKNLTIQKYGIVSLPAGNNESLQLLSYGMFSNFSGLLYRVVMENAEININISETTSDELYISCGLVSGLGSGIHNTDESMWISSLVNCKIEGNINVMCLAEGEGICGGLIGVGLLVDVKNCEYVGKISINSLMEFSVSSLYFSTLERPGADSFSSYADITVNGEVIAPENHVNDDGACYNCIFDSYENRPNK